MASNRIPRHFTRITGEMLKYSNYRRFYNEH